MLFKFYSRERERERGTAVVGENQVLMRPQTEMHFAGNFMLHFVTGGKYADKVPKIESEEQRIEWKDEREKKNKAI